MGTGIFFTMYSQTTSILYFSWAEMGITGDPSAIVPRVGAARRWSGGEIVWGRRGDRVGAARRWSGGGEEMEWGRDRVGEEGRWSGGEIEWGRRGDGVGDR